jgi:uncharacterized protein YbaR (Trm112 family)
MMSAGLKVVCPQCKRKKFVTTEHYNPDISPNGSMVRFLGGYHIDWLTTSATKVSEMACPECQGQLAPSGRLTVIEETKTLMETEEAMVEQFAEMDKADQLPKVGKPVHICDICGKELKTAGALTLHKRSHKEANNG